jgi:hypothetical protein
VQVTHAKEAAVPELSSYLPSGETLAALEVKAEALAHLPAQALLAVNVKPNPNALPGSSAAEKLVDGLAYFIILGCIAGALFGIGQWVLGSRTSNYSQSESGRTKVAVAVFGAFLVGALAAIINFFVSAGSAVK